MSIALPFADYRFTFKALDALTLPEHSGTLWHSVMGKALHDSSCIVPQVDCQSCLFKQQCDYPLLFKGVKPNNSQLMKRYHNIPAPHIFRIQQPYATSFKSQQYFSVNIILLGQINNKLERLVNVMQKVGDNGFRHRRKKAQLVQVVQEKPHGIDQHVALPSPQNHLSQPNNAIHYPIPEHIPQKVRLTLLSPFRPTGDAIQSTTFLLDKMIMGLIRRVSLLQYFYTGQALNADYSALKQHTQRLPILHHTMQWQRHESLAQRKNQHRQGYAWSGSIDMDLEPHQALWPYLYLGQWLHVGKNASMGFGRYELTDISS